MLKRGRPSPPWSKAWTILLLVCSCAPSQVSHMKLDLDVGTSISYTITFWNQARPDTTRLRMVVHVTEASDLDYSLTGMISGQEEGTVMLEVSHGGRAALSAYSGISDPLLTFISSGLIGPCVPLPKEPVSPGQSWDTNISGCRGYYTYRARGFLEGRGGYIIEFRLSGDKLESTGKCVISHENGLVQASAGTIAIGSETFGYRMVRE
ncbi:MAG: hypothetical protein ABIM74_09930 [candidate division WOR-3 bacterium]